MLTSRQNQLHVTSSTCSKVHEQNEAYALNKTYRRISHQSFMYVCFGVGERCLNKKERDRMNLTAMVVKGL